MPNTGCRTAGILNGTQLRSRQESSPVQPEHAREDEVRPGGDGRLHPGGRRGNCAEQERQDGGPGHQVRRAGADGGRRELRGHDRPGQRVRHAGQGAARGSRAPHEAARGNAIAVVDRGIQTLYVNMFEGPVTGNIPEVLDNGEVTDGTHVTAGQLALALMPYAQVTDLAVNTAASGNNAAAIQSLDARVTAELASAALATTDGQVAAHGSSIAALQSSLTTGLSNKADQPAFDVLEGVVATKSTPDGVDLKLSNYSTTAAMNGSIASANNATLATAAANYGLKTVVDQHSLDIAARITPMEVDTKVANALLGAVTAAALASELASRDASISGLQASKADASALTAYVLLSAVDTSSEVDSKIATALLGAVTTAALDAALAGKADTSALASLLSTVDGLDTPLEVDTKIANAVLGLATEAFVAAQLASRDTGRGAAGLIRHERRALRQRDHAPERPRRNPRGARRPAASRRRSC